MNDTKITVRSGQVRSLGASTSSVKSPHSNWSSSHTVVKVSGANGKRRIDAINQHLRGTSKPLTSTSK